MDWNKIQDGGQQFKKPEDKVDTYFPMDPVKVKQNMVEIMKPGIMKLYIWAKLKNSVFVRDGIQKFKEGFYFPDILVE